ncbi:hypothetical protein BC828DRAFT_393787 [Blastocladiella britannica]|nr:hypothetical protein BC828DRAFT_393787 [Blastocladiella britannica]
MSDPTELAVAYIQGFPIDLSRTFHLASETGECSTCKTAGGDPRNKADPEWIVRAIPATDLELALVCRTADAALHNVLAADPNAIRDQWERVLGDFDLFALLHARNQVRRLDRRLLLDAGIEPLEAGHGFDGAGLQVSAVLVSAALRTFMAFLMPVIREVRWLGLFWPWSPRWERGTV